MDEDKGCDLSCLFMYEEQKITIKDFSGFISRTKQQTPTKVTLFFTGTRVTIVLKNK